MKAMSDIEKERWRDGFALGAQAFADGLSRNRNPHESATSPESIGWDDGWLHARNESERS